MCVEECHRVLDGRFEDTVDEVVDDLAVERLDRWSLMAGEDRCGHDDLRLSIQGCSRRRGVLDEGSEDLVDAL